jgi:hypothetical protein
LVATCDKSRYTAAHYQGVRKLRCRKANPKNLIRIMPAEGWCL